MVAGLALLLLPSLASAGSAPIEPNPYSKAAQQALAVANTTTQSVVSTITFAFNYSFATAPCGGTCLAIATATVSINNVTTFGATLLAATTSISPLRSPTNPGVIQVTCGGTNFPYAYLTTLTIPRICLALTFNWNSGHFQGEPPISYLITRTITLRQLTTVTWGSTGPCSQIVAQIYIPGAHQFYLAYTTQKWNVTSVTYAVGFPQGNWNLPATTFYDANASQFYASNFFTVSQRSFLAEWTNYPTTTVVGTVGSSGYQTIRSMRISPCLVQGTPGTKNQTAPNGTVPSGMPIFPQSITLTLGQFGQTTPGNYTASVQWTNNLTAPYSGEFILLASWVAQVGFARVYANGQPLAQTQFAVTNTSIVIYPSSVTIANGTVVEFTVAFAAVSPFTFTSAVGILNQVPVTTTDIYFLGVGVVVFILILMRIAKIHTARVDLILSFLAAALAIGLTLGVAPT